MGGSAEILSDGAETHIAARPEGVSGKDRRFTLETGREPE